MQKKVQSRSISFVKYLLKKLFSSIYLMDSSAHIEKKKEKRKCYPNEAIYSLYDRVSTLASILHILYIIYVNALPTITIDIYSIENA